MGRLGLGRFPSGKTGGPREVSVPEHTRGRGGSLGLTAGGGVRRWSSDVERRGRLSSGVFPPVTQSHGSSLGTCVVRDSLTSFLPGSDPVGPLPLWYRRPLRRKYTRTGRRGCRVCALWGLVPS